MIPDYINCKNEEIFVCDYLLTKGCKNTCMYSRSLGIGSMTITPEKAISMDELPTYGDCRNEEVIWCRYFGNKLVCEETCAYAKGLEKEIEDEKESR